MQLVLASSSKSRLKLLEQISLYPDHICATNINETPLKKELPVNLAVRLAKEKAMSVVENFDDAFIIAADTVSAVGRRILDKAENDENVKSHLTLLSGRRHQVYTAVCVAKIVNKKLVKLVDRLVKTTIKFKKLTDTEIKEYIESKQGIGMSGGCSINGIAESYILWIGGSYSNVIGLPLYETKSLLFGLGYKK